MLNEWDEFRAYTEFPVYTSSGKTDYSFLGRFTFDMLLIFEGFARILTVLARGFMWKDTEADPDRARNALFAWCSVPDNKEINADWQFGTAFPELHDAFPDLVNEDGVGWLCRHVRNLCRYVEDHPKTVSKRAREHCAVLSSGFEEAWREKVVKMQVPLFAPTTRGAWIIRFDDILADAMELGPLRNRDFDLPDETAEKLLERLPEKLPFQAAETLLKYYAANHSDSTDWVVLPVTNFDAYFGNTNFSRKWLALIPESILTRESCFGVCRYRIAPDLLEGIKDRFAGSA